MKRKSSFFRLPKEPAKAERWELISMLCGGITIIAGFVAFAGWVFKIQSLTSFFSDGVVMKVNTAFLLIFSGWSLIALSRRYYLLARICLFIILCFSIAVIYEFVSGADLRIDQLFIRDHFVQSKLEIPGRMSLLTALYILLCSLAMLLSSLKRYDAAQFAGTMLVGFIYIALLGHLFHFAGFFFPAVNSGLAFHTAMALLLLAAGTVILQPDQGWIRQVYRRIARKNLLVYLLSYILGAAPLFAALYLFVIKNSTIAPASDMLVLFMLTIILSVPVAYFLLRLFRRLDDNIKGAHEQLRIAVHASGLGVWDLDLEQGLLSHSEKFAELFGKRGEQLTTTKSLWSTFHPDFREAAQTAFEQALQAGQLDFQVKVVMDSETDRWIQFYGETKRNRRGIPVRLLGTAMDITARKELEKQKDEFISVASHELKTPLTSLKSYVQLAHVKSKSLDDQTIDSMLTRAEIQITKMTRLIADFLNTAQSEAGKMTLNKSEFLLHSLIREVIADIAVTHKNHEIVFEGCLPFTIVADREKVERVLINLIGNALKYTIGHRPVILTCDKDADSAIICINDHGVGISEEDKLHLFDRFYRAANPNTRTVSGFGIGLYLSAEIVRLHGGDIGVDSEVGKGSRFWFNLPVGIEINSAAAVLSK